MKTRYVQNKDGRLIPVFESGRPEMPEIMPDIKPYKSMLDGSEITSRSKHREHLKRHNAYEIGNEVSALMKPRETTNVEPKQRKELIVAQIQELGHEGFKKALKKDVEFIKWNSRNLPKQEN